MERELTWEGWAERPADSVLTPAGEATVCWAVDTVRRFLGESWLADNAAASGHVPLLNPRWWPLTNRRTIVRILRAGGSFSSRHRIVAMW